MKKVIIIDDSKTSLSLIEAGFVNQGFKTINAKNIKDAFDLIFSYAPDLIITDVLLSSSGGFQFLKQVRENKLISKIPVIIYSVLKKSTADFYLKEPEREFFLTKNNNTDELIDLAKKVIENNPIDDEYKNNIVNFKKGIAEEIIKEKTKEIKAEKQILKFDIEKLTKDIKTNYNNLINDEKTAAILFSILYPILNYDLAVFHFYNFKTNKPEVYLDIKNLIISPILQNFFLEKYSCESLVLNKTYAPNLKSISSVEEFNSKIDFSFEYYEKPTGSFAFYCLNSNVWENYDNLDEIKTLLKDFLKTRYINKTSLNTSKDNVSNKYLNKIDLNLKSKFNPSKTKIGMYFGIINITNYSDFESNFEKEEIDFLNSKIAEKIVNCLEKEEQIFKTKEDEYDIVIFANDDTQALRKFGNIVANINSIAFEDHHLDSVVGISNCYIEGTFNTYQAQKHARIALNDINENKKAVIYGK